MIGEFGMMMQEAFGNIASPDLGGETWVVKTTGTTFRGAQAHSQGTYEDAMGGQDFKRTVRLSCTRDDFAGGYPKKQTVVYRQNAPNVLYLVAEDASVENDVSPTFTLTLALKH